MAGERQPRSGRGLALALVGAVLVAWPWLPRRQQNPLPREFAAGSPSQAVLLANVRSVDACCRAGDVEGLRSAVTPGYLSLLRERLRQLDRALDRRTLLDSAASDGERDEASKLARMRFLSGGSQGDRACMVYGYGDVFDGYRLLRFCWDGAGFRLDQARDVRRPVGTGRIHAARQLADAALQVDDSR